jgi:hypothetical protein
MTGRQAGPRYAGLLTPRSSGWIPALLLGLATVVVVTSDGTSVRDVVTFGMYIVFGIALPGTLWVRLLRGRPAHLSEDLALGLAVGYCLEIATYVAARAVGLPLLFLVWPALTLAAFLAIPSLRHHWRGSGQRAPGWWSWSLAAILGYVLVFSAATFFATHHVMGTDTPYVDMPYHLALIGELRHHVPPSIPYVSGLPLAYHWFFYAEAAATSWATGIEPLALLYRLSGVPYFVAFVVMTAHAARRLTGGWWTGPVAVAFALLGTVAAPYRWTGSPVFDPAILGSTWISPTNLVGVTLFAAVILVLMDLLPATRRPESGAWLLVALLIAGIAGAKASLLPMLIVGLVAIVGGVAVTGRHFSRPAAAALGIATCALVLAAILLFQGSTGGLVIGLESLRSLPVVALTGGDDAKGTVAVAVAAAGLLVALVLWSFLWAGAYGLLGRRGGAFADPRILLLLGICGAALGAVIVFSYPGLSQVYYLRGAAGAFGLLAAFGIARILPARSWQPELMGAVAIAAVAGAGSIMAIRAIGPAQPPGLREAGFAGLLLAILMPIGALVAVVAVGSALILALTRSRSRLRGAGGILLIALAMGFSLPNLAVFLVAPFALPRASGETIPADAIAAARWLRDNSASSDLVATNLHCLPRPGASGPCDARHFWVSGFTERHVLVEGWAYTTVAAAYGVEHGVTDRTVPFWNQAALTVNDTAFADPSPETIATLRDRYGVRWLFADTSRGASPALADVADLRHREGPFAVYEVRRR